MGTAPCHAGMNRWHRVVGIDEAGTTYSALTLNAKKGYEAGYLKILEIQFFIRHRLPPWT
jgi:hypothetical protein